MNSFENLRLYTTAFRELHLRSDLGDLVEREIVGVFT